MSCKGECKATAHVLGLICIFKEFAERDADKDHLSKSELKDLLNREFPGLLSESKPEDVTKMMAALDSDQDGQVDITEYMVLLCTLGISMYELMKGKGGQCPKKK